MKIWQANPVGQKTLLALHSGNVAGVNLADHGPDGKLRKEEEEKDRKAELLQEMTAMIHQQFLETIYEVRETIDDARQFFQEKLNDLERDETEFYKDVIALSNGQTVYPDANDPSRYYVQDENGQWQELINENQLEEARKNHEEMGSARTKQAKDAWDNYEAEVKNAPQAIDDAENSLEGLQDQVDKGIISAQEGQNQAKQIGQDIEKLEKGFNVDFNNATFGGKAEFVGSVIKTSESEYKQSNEQGKVYLDADDDLLNDSYDSSISNSTSFPSP